jgi:hypothetical protein
MNAADYITAAATSAAHLHDPLDRMAHTIGHLQASIRELCAKYTGEGQRPQTGCNFYTATVGDASVLVEYEYEPGEASQTSGPPERCYEGTPASVSIIQALVNGAWCDPTDVFPESVLERWAEEIAEREDESAADASEEYERDRYDDSRDFAEAA